jgi:hypothetical protein
MSQWLLIMFLLYPDGSIHSFAEFHTGADLCLSRRDEAIAMMAEDRAEGTFHAECMDSKLYLGNPS